MHEDLKQIQDKLKAINEKRKKEAKIREEKESNEDPSLKDKNVVIQHPSSTDQYTEEEKSLKSKEKKLLEKI